MKRLIILAAVLFICSGCTQKLDLKLQATPGIVKAEEEYIETNDIKPGYHVYESNENGYFMSVPDEIDVKIDNNSGVERIDIPPYGSIEIKKTDSFCYIPNNTDEVKNIILKSRYNDIVTEEFIITDFEKIKKNSVDIGYRCMLNFSAEKSIYLKEIKLSDNETICAVAFINTSVQTMEQKLVAIINSIESIGYL